MKSFLEFLIENMEQFGEGSPGYVSPDMEQFGDGPYGSGGGLPQKNKSNNFIFVVDGNGNLATAHYYMDHQTAFGNMYFNHPYEEPLPYQKVPPRSHHARSWGRVDDGVATLITPEGVNSSGNEDDVFDRLHAIDKLRKHLKEIPFMIHAGAEDGRQILHSPREHEKHLTGLLK